MPMNSNIKEFVNLCEKKDAFDCAGIRGHRKTWALIPAQSKRLFFRIKIFKFFKCFKSIVKFTSILL